MAPFDGVVRARARSPASTDSESIADIDLVGRTSPGARRTQIIAENLTKREKWYIFGGLFLFGWAYGMESLLRVMYQPFATSGFAKHSTLATINVVRSVVAAAAYPAAARFADVFGRLEMVIASVIFHVLGTILDASSKGVGQFAAGAVIYQVGYTSMLLLVEVIVADITPLKARLGFSYVPTLPFLFNTWASGYFFEAVMKNLTWQKGLGMWAAIMTGMSAPLILALWLPYRRVKQEGRLNDFDSPFERLGFQKLMIALFWQVDVIGIALLMAMFTFILVPLTVAGHDPNNWKQGKILGPLIAGGLICTGLWLKWEHHYAPYPMLRIRLLRDRAVWGALGIACMLQFSWNLQGNFLGTVVIVAFGMPTRRATWLVSMYSFCSVLTGFTLGLVVLHVQRIKHLRIFIRAGTALFFVAFGLLYKFRGGTKVSDDAGIWGSQVLLGVAGGLFPYPAQTTIQAATKHKHVALVTGLYLATFNIGSAIGNAVSGAIWTLKLAPSLLASLPEPYNTEAIAQDIVASPFKYTAEYDIGTPFRNGMITSYRHTQRWLTIAGLAVCAPLVFFSIVIRDPPLGDEQSLPDAEKYGAVSRQSQPEIRSPWERLKEQFTL